MKQGRETQREGSPRKKPAQGRRKVTTKLIRGMGRGKTEIKRIENTNNRQVTYSKRRNGIIKKAKEISVLCNAHVSVVMFSCSGKMHEYCSPRASLVDILDRYHTQCGKRLWDAKHELKQKEEAIRELYLHGSTSCITQCNLQQQTEMMMAVNGRGGDDACHQRLDSHMPFAFLGQPVQPKLQERI